MEDNYDAMLTKCLWLLNKPSQQNPTRTQFYSLQFSSVLGVLLLTRAKKKKLPGSGGVGRQTIFYTIFDEALLISKELCVDKIPSILSFPSPRPILILVGGTIQVQKTLLGCHTDWLGTLTVTIIGYLMSWRNLYMFWFSCRTTHHGGWPKEVRSEKRWRGGTGRIFFKALVQYANAPVKVQYCSKF